MNTDKTENNDDNVEIPVFIRAVLIVIAAAINLPILMNEITWESIISFVLFVSKNLVLLPGLFVIFGLLLRFRDDTFKLSNAYYLGVLIAIVLAVQGMKGM
jgi:hypothetical protein